MRWEKPAALAAILCLCSVLAAAAAASRGVPPVVEWPITVPDSYKVEGRDEYVCVVKELPPEPHKVVGVKPLADESVVHHMLLYGCSSPAKHPPPGETVAWNCFHHGVCGSGGSEILYGWGRNAPQLTLPSDVALSVGNSTNIRFIVVQVHFKANKPAGDRCGVALQLRAHPTPYSTGIITFAAGFVIPPNTKSTKVSVQCCYSAHQPVTTLAFRVHTHTLGRSVTMERESWNRSGTEVVATNNPLLPQAFYPVKRTVIWPGDRLKVTCDFDSTGRMRPTSAGSTNEDEMCNMYMLVYSPIPFLTFCGGNAVMEAGDDMPGLMPASGRMVPDPCLFWKPPGRGLGATQQQPLQEEGGDRPVPQALGMVTGVALGGDGSLWAFYRGNHVWTASTFDGGFRMVDPTPIQAHVIVRLNPETGAVMQRLGAHLFGMPHMVTVDNLGNIWAVDVGLHQVVKMDRQGQMLMTVGMPGQPGSGPGAFCQPTHVAVARDGSFYVADGYCNSRVVKFTANGTYIGEAPIPTAAGRPHPVVHSVMLDECTNHLYVAARETGQVVLVDTNTLAVMRTIDLKAQGRVWSIVMGPYGSPLALVWDQGQDGELVDLRSSWAWVLPGTAQAFPHQVALGAAPPALSGAADRLFALYVAPTCERGCGPLQRFVLLPDGMQLPDVSMLRPTLTHSVLSGDGTSTRPVGALDDALGQQQQGDEVEDAAVATHTPTTSSASAQQPLLDAERETGGERAGGEPHGAGPGAQQAQRDFRGTVQVTDRRSDPAAHIEYANVLAMPRDGQGTTGGLMPPWAPLHGYGWGARLGAVAALVAAMAAVVAVLSRRLVGKRGGGEGADEGRAKRSNPATMDELLARSAELKGLEEVSTTPVAATVASLHARGPQLSQPSGVVLLSAPQEARRH